MNNAAFDPNKKRKNLQQPAVRSSATATVNRPAGSSSAGVQAAGVQRSGSQQRITTPTPPTTTTPNTTVKANTAVKVESPVTDTQGGIRQVVGGVVQPAQVASPTQAKTQAGTLQTATGETAAQRKKTITDMYLEMGNSPEVDAIVAEMQAEEQAKKQSTTRTQAEKEALGKAVVESLYQKPNEAVAAGRQAEANAYDAARRGAGGAGTSYAAAAGAQAYQSAYEDTRDRMEADAAAEQERQAELFNTVYDAYNGTNEDSIRLWLRQQGVSAQDAELYIRTVRGDYDKADAAAEEAARPERQRELFRELLDLKTGDYDMDVTDEFMRMYAEELGGYSDEDIDAVMEMLAAADGGASARAAELGYDEELANQIFNEVLMAEDEEGNLSYDPAYRGSTRQMLLKMDGVDEATADAALDMFDEWYSTHNAETVEKNGKIAADAIKKGDDATMQALTGMSDEAWAELDDGQRAATALDALGDMVLHNGLDSAVFADALLDSLDETMESVIEEYKKYHDEEDTLMKTANSVLMVEKLYDEGKMSNTDYQNAMAEIVTWAGKTGGKIIRESSGAGRKKTSYSIGEFYLQGKKVDIDGKIFSNEQKKALEKLIEFYHSVAG